MLSVGALVDAVTPDVVLKAVADAGVTVSQVLTTHHHYDHAGFQSIILFCVIYFGFSPMATDMPLNYATIASL